jgi:hypothetical protein
MDHLALPRKPVKPPLEIPFVCKSGYIYGQDNFIDYPAQHLESLQSSEPAITREEALASLLQSWLYFGTLAEFFQRAIDINLFTRLSTDGSLVLYTNHLQILKGQWMESQRIADDETRENVIHQCTTVLTRALYACEVFEEAGFEIEALQGILVSIKILLCSLTISTQSGTTIPSSSSKLSVLMSRLTFKPNLPYGTATREFLFLDHMVANGWWLV